MSITVLGNDKRFEYLAKMPLDEVLKSETVILPVPSTKDGEHIKDTEVPLSSLAERYKTVIGYGLPLSFTNLLKDKNIRYLDLNNDENYLIKNAELTAEATISEIISILNEPINNKNIIIVGYGRIGRFLTEYTKCFKAKITVLTGSKEKSKYLSAKGINALPYEKINEAVFENTLILNTAPLKVINGLSFEKGKTILFDLNSSKADEIETAKESHGSYRLLSGLPAKHFPKAAAKIIFETIKIHKEANHIE